MVAGGIPQAVPLSPSHWSQREVVAATGDPSWCCCSGECEIVRCKGCCSLAAEFVVEMTLFVGCCSYCC